MPARTGRGLGHAFHTNLDVLFTLKLFKGSYKHLEATLNRFNGFLTVRGRQGHAQQGVVAEAEVIALVTPDASDI